MGFCPFDEVILVAAEQRQQSELMDKLNVLVLHEAYPHKSFLEKQLLAQQCKHDKSHEPHCQWCCSHRQPHSIYSSDQLVKAHHAPKWKTSHELINSYFRWLFQIKCSSSSHSVASYADHPFITHPTSPPTETRLDHTTSDRMGGGSTAASRQTAWFCSHKSSWIEVEAVQHTFWFIYKRKTLLCAPLPSIRRVHRVSGCAHLLLLWWAWQQSRAGWTKPWEREREREKERERERSFCE